MPYNHMNDWADWFWMVPMMLLWLITIGAIIYIAVRLANRDSHRDSH